MIMTLYKLKWSWLFIINTGNSLLPNIILIAIPYLGGDLVLSLWDYLNFDRLSISASLSFVCIFYVNKMFIVLFSMFQCQGLAGFSIVVYNISWFPWNQRHNGPELPSGSFLMTCRWHFVAAFRHEYLTQIKFKVTST